jgi:hypothetical protein
MEMKALFLQDSKIDFMLLTIVILTLTLAVVVALFHRTLLSFFLNPQTKKRLITEGVEAEAVLLNMQQTGLYVNNQPQVKLQMQVQPDSGCDFIIEAKEVLTYVDLAQLHIGGTLVVKYNPCNVKEVMLVREDILITQYPYRN